VGLHPFVYPDTLNDGVEYVIENQLGLMSNSVKDKVRNTNTKALIQAMENYDLDFITHPNLKMPVDLPELAQACLRHEVALEINTGHHYDKTGIVVEAAPYGVKFVVNSDAHYPETVGELASGIDLLEQYAIPVEQIVNAIE
jgi:putative hydrolase